LARRGVSVFPERPSPSRLRRQHDLFAAYWRDESAYRTIGIRVLTRAAGGSAAVASPVSCIYLPGKFGNAALTNDRLEDLRLYLAHSGMTVYVVDYRTHFVDEDSVRSTEACATWTTADFLQDVYDVIAAVREERPEAPLFLVGHSTGAKFAYLAAADAAASEFDGLVSIDGWLASASTSGRDHGRQLRSPLEHNPCAGSRELDDRELRVLRARLVGTRAGNLVAPDAPLADVRRVHRLLASSDPLWPRRQSLELQTRAQDIAVAELSRISLPLLNVVAGSRGDAFVDASRSTASLTASRARRELFVPRVGHLEILVGSRARSSFPAISAWLAESAAGVARKRRRIRRGALDATRANAASAPRACEASRPRIRSSPA
jgi:alpha-beta hydrolase superfamily lysophospholipase